MPDHPQHPTDLLTARDIAREYGLSQRTAENLVRSLGRRGLLVTFPGFRRAFVRREDVQPRVGATTCD